MRDIERLLRDAPRVPPPARLDASVATALDRAGARRHLLRCPAPLWACVAAVAACAALGFLVRGATRPATPPVVVVLPTRGELRNVLMGETGDGAAAGTGGFTVSVSVGATPSR